MRKTRDTALSFINEQKDDFIVSFYVADDDYGEGRSITLIREKKYEFVIPENEKGVNVSDENFPLTTKWEKNNLVSVMLEGNTIELVSELHHHIINLRKAVPEELAEAIEIIKAMNFDNRFELTINDPA